MKRFGLWGLIAASLFGLAGCSTAPGGPATSPSVRSSGQASATASPNGETEPTASSEEIANLTPTWQVNATELTTADNPMVSTLLAVDQNNWLVQLVAGPSAAPFSQMVPIDPATGLPLAGLAQAPVTGAGALPEFIYCAQQLWLGQVLCAWDSSVWAIDPATGQLASPVPVATALDQYLYGVAVVGDLIITAGLDATNPTVTAIDGAGQVQWSFPFGVAGCPLEDPAHRVSITEVDGLIRLSFGSQNALIEPVSGQVLVAVCGLVDYGPNGQIVAAQPYQDQPEPPVSYSDPSGTVHTLLNVGQARYLNVIEAQTGAYALALDEDSQRLRLYELASGQQLWEQEWQYGRLQTWDESQLYLSGRRGFSAIDIVSGEIAWTWQHDLGQSNRTGVLTHNGGLVFAHSFGVSGLTLGGVEVWFTDDPQLAGYYWTPAGPGPQAVRLGNQVVYLGANREQISRLDVPALP